MGCEAPLLKTGNAGGLGSYSDGSAQEQVKSFEPRELQNSRRCRGIVAWAALKRLANIEQEELRSGARHESHPFNFGVL